jgi:ribosomal protein L37E
MEPDEFVPVAVEAGLSREMYLAVTDGDGVPYTECPHCGAEAYILSDQECAVCGESVEHECARCGNEIPVSELSTGSLCGYCDHMMNKDD